LQSVLQKSEQVRYSGAVTSMTPAKQWLSAGKMRLFGFRDVKVKVGAQGIDDRDCVQRVRRIVGANVVLRLDANEAWHCDQVIARMQPLLPFSPASLEQPVPHAEVSGLAAVRRQLSVPVMLDESLCCHEDGLRAIQGGWCDLFNIRLSKCGGLIRSARLAVLAAQHGLGYQLGCQVGETGILSAAGRHFACSIGHIRFLEGSYDRFLVRERLTQEDLTFGYGGRASRLPGPGLGVTVNEQRVQELAVRTLELIE
jgi:L-alanine-DL-glutamate epimerase-like enolase superfamily enzyme